MHAPSQWETTLRGNIVSHWLATYTKISLRNITFMFPRSRGERVPSIDGHIWWWTVGHLKQEPRTMSSRYPTLIFLRLTIDIYPSVFFPIHSIPYPHFFSHLLHIISFFSNHSMSYRHFLPIYSTSQPHFSLNLLLIFYFNFSGLNYQ